MKSNVKSIFLDIMALFNLTINRLNEKASVLSLIGKLQPFTTDKNLIRFGPNGDGGYLIPDDISGIEACFSPGVGLLSLFEEDCAKNEMKVFLADKSVDSPAVNNPKFHFIKRFIGPITNENFITLDDWVNSSNLESKNSDLLLQMDIEGYEYSTILNMSNILMKRFRIIVVEFHSLNKLWDNEFFTIASLVFEKLLQYHTCVHIHPNNSCGAVKIKGVEIPKLAEFTFIRNDRIVKKVKNINFPHALDFDSDLNYKTMTLPNIWYGGSVNKFK